MLAGLRRATRLAPAPRARLAAAVALSALTVLALARAVLSRARFLVLDEPTAQLDPATGHAVMRGIDRAAGDRGVLVITHDPAVVAHADRVVELRGGRLLERTDAGSAHAPDLHPAVWY